jgi:hypothetical protein
LNDIEDATLLDLGGRIRWQKNALLLSSEFVHRHRTGSSSAAGNSVRLVGEFEYRVSEQLSIMASFGKNYDQRGPGGQTLVSVVGLNFGFGPVPVLCLEARNRCK